MRKTLVKIGDWIRGLIDFFYPPFRKFISPELFRYAACGGGNIVFDWALYALLYNCVIQHRIVDLGFVALSPHIAAFLIVFPITTFTGFLLQKYVTFTSSYLRGSVQLFRYFMVVITNMLIIYFGLKLFVDVIGFYPTPSKMLVTGVTVVLSYLAQKKFTFRVKQ